jgi:hypothetical protein
VVVDGIPAGIAVEGFGFNGRLSAAAGIVFNGGEANE